MIYTTPASVENKARRVQGYTLGSVIEATTWKSVTLVSTTMETLEIDFSFPSDADSTSSDIKDKAPSSSTDLHRSHKLDGVDVENSAVSTASP